MRITRGRHLTINMGNYENYKVIAEVTVSHHDLGLSDDDLSQRSPEDNAITAAELQAFVADQLDAALEQELEDAAELTSEKKTFIKRL